MTAYSISYGNILFWSLMFQYSTLRIMLYKCSGLKKQEIGKSNKQVRTQLMKSTFPLPIFTALKILYP